MQAVSRTLASLQKYEEHPYATCDIDPWRHLENLYPPTRNTHDNKPCWLPRPAILDKAPFEELSDRLVEARRLGWYLNEKYFYIPPDDCRLEDVERSTWRNGYAFPRVKITGWKGPCPIDYKGQVWCWDMNERHWDVQLNPHIRINHVGLKL